MTLRDEDVAVARDGDVVGLKKEAWIDGTTSLAERHQEFSIGAELEHVMTFRCAGRSSKRSSPSAATLRRGSLTRPSGWSRCAGRGRTACGTRSVVLIVGDPHIAITIDMNAVRSHDQAGAKGPHEPAFRIKEKNRIDTCRLEARTVSAAALGDPDAFAVLGDLDRARRAPHPAGGKLRPILDGSIGIWRVVHGHGSRLPAGNRDGAHNDSSRQHRSGCTNAGFKPVARGFSPASAVLKACATRGFEISSRHSSWRRFHRETPAEAAFTDTPTWTFVQQHWKPPPPSPDESLT